MASSAQWGARLEGCGGTSGVLRLPAVGPLLSPECSSSPTLGVSAAGQVTAGLAWSRGQSGGGDTLLRGSQAEIQVSAGPLSHARLGGPSQLPSCWQDSVFCSCRSKVPLRCLSPKVPLSSPGHPQFPATCPRPAGGALTPESAAAASLSSGSPSLVRSSLPGGRDVRAECQGGPLGPPRPVPPSPELHLSTRLRCRKPRPVPLLLLDPAPFGKGDGRRGEGKHWNVWSIVPDGARGCPQVP